MRQADRYCSGTVRDKQKDGFHFTDRLSGKEKASLTSPTSTPSGLLIVNSLKNLWHVTKATSTVIFAVLFCQSSNYKSIKTLTVT